MEIEKDSCVGKLERADSVVELANKSLELGNTLLENFNLLVTTDTHEKLEEESHSEIDILSPTTNARLTRRCRVVMEVVETEKRYVDGLYLLINHFFTPLTDSGLLSQHDLNLIFPSCVQHIYLLHSEIFFRLSERVVNWGPRSTIADLLRLYFISNGDYMFNIYHQFLSSFSTAVSTIQHSCANDKQVRRCVEELESNGVCKRLKITSYMTTPVQRMPRYILLLKELMKVTERGSEEYGGLDECVGHLGVYMARLNEGLESSICDGGGVSKGYDGGMSKGGMSKGEIGIGVVIKNSSIGKSNNSGLSSSNSSSGGGGNITDVVNGCKVKEVKKKISFNLKGSLMWKKKTNNQPLKAFRSTSFQCSQPIHPLSLNPRSLSNIDGKENMVNGGGVLGSGGQNICVVSEKKALMDRLLRKKETKGNVDMINVSCVSNAKNLFNLKRKLSSLTDLGSSFRNKYLKPIKSSGGEEKVKDGWKEGKTQNKDGIIGFDCCNNTDNIGGEDKKSKTLG